MHDQTLWDGYLKDLVEVREDGCWNWLGPTKADKYGNSPPWAEIPRPRRADRAIWTALKGPVDDKKNFYCTCSRKTACVNPAHKEPKYPREHFRELKQQQRKARAEAVAAGLPPPKIKTKLSIEQLLKNKEQYMIRALARRFENGEIEIEQYTRAWKFIRSGAHPDLEEYKRAIEAGEIYEFVPK